MAKKAFTLIELIISIIIISLIVTYLYESLGILNKSGEQLFKRDKSREYETDIKKLLVLDIMQGYDFNLSKTDSRDFDILTFSSLNSIHGIKKPKITYLVSKKDNTLFRIEGIDYTIPLDSETIYRVKYDELKKELEYFKVFFNKDKKKVLINIKAKSSQPIVLETLRL